MNVKPDPKVLEEASRWSARLLAADCTAEERARFAVWLGNPVHARAYASALKLQQLLSHSAHHPRLQALAAQALIEERQPASTVRERVSELQRPAQRPALRPRGWLVPASLAASLALALIGIGVVRQEPATKSHLLSTFETLPGQRQTFTLEDGTLVHADVASRLTVRMDASAREVELQSGRALFSVAHDSRRPFAVRAGSTRTVALGTQFQVQRQPDATLISLTEGSVRISGGAPGSGWVETLVPGEQIELDSIEAVPRKRAIDSLQVTSWSRGRLLFRDTPLAAALEEINRYAPLKVRLADPTLANLKVGGNFIAGDSRPIVSAFATFLPLTVVESGGELLLLRRNDTGG